MTWLDAHLTGLAWCAAGWALVIAVVAGLLYARWRRHEDHDAAETELVLQSLASDDTKVHIWDGVN